ncbi:MAG TPA: 50S ribosomal protein L11 methyltransferase [Thermoanaerobaculia bacterium]
MTAPALYRRRVYLAPPEHEDLLVADLWEEGSVGMRSDPAPSGKVRVEAYFPIDGPALEQDLEAERRARGIELLLSDDLPPTDWLADYRASARPFAIATSLFVDPREPEHAAEEPIAVPPGRTLLKLPARAAFGTGSHESTALALELLEETDVRGRRVLDVGAGTGVLSFAALRRGARRAVAFDLDPAAPFHARDNSALNDLHPLLYAGRLAALRRPLPPARRFDRALVNVVPEQILPEMPAVAELLAPGGDAILSGILVERGRMVIDRLRGLGFAVAAQRQAGDWIAYSMTLAG